MAIISTESVEPDLDIPEDEQTYQEIVKQILARSKAALIEVSVVEGLLYDHEYNVKIPQGRGAREINIWSTHSASEFVSVPFEEYRYIAGYSAVYSENADLIEADVEILSGATLRSVQKRLFGSKISRSRAEETSYRLQLANSNSGTSIELGQPSRLLKAFRQTAPTGIALQIKGFGIRSHDEALRQLTKLFDSFSFQIDLAADVPLGLVRDRHVRRSKKIVRETAAAVRAMEYPTREYDHAPMSLYQYGRSAVGIPLLQFLAFYQVVEFYYPTYANSEARRRVRNILKDPSFRVDRDGDIGRVMSILRSGGGGVGSERTQLKAAIRECVDADSLREFIQASAPRLEHFTAKPKRASHLRLIPSDPKVDLLSDVSDRLYNIRCEIVHSKDDGDAASAQQRLLPFTAEAEQIVHDIELMQFVAERLLIASSTELA